MTANLKKKERKKNGKSRYENENMNVFAFLLWSLQGKSLQPCETKHMHFILINIKTAPSNMIHNY